MCKKKKKRKRKGIIKERTDGRACRIEEPQVRQAEQKVNTTTDRNWKLVGIGNGRQEKC